VDESLGCVGGLVAHVRNEDGLGFRGARAEALEQNAVNLDQRRVLDTQMPNDLQDEDNVGNVRADVPSEHPRDTENPSRKPPVLFP
jgi:hypothetical protein